MKKFVSIIILCVMFASPSFGFGLQHGAIGKLTVLNKIEGAVDSVTNRWCEELGLIDRLTLAFGGIRKVDEIVSISMKKAFIELVDEGIVPSNFDQTNLEASITRVNSFAQGLSKREKKVLEKMTRVAVSEFRQVLDDDTLEILEMLSVVDWIRLAFASNDDQ